MACPRIKKASVVVTILIVAICLDKTLEREVFHTHGLDVNGYVNLLTLARSMLSFLVHAFIFTWHEEHGN